MTSLGVEWGAKYTLVGPDGTTVVFNDSSDPNFIGVLSPESSGLDSADIREDATDAVEEDGGHHGDFFEGRRPVVLQGTIIASSATQRNERVGKLKRASRALRRDATLTWEPAGGPEGGVELKLRRQQPLRVTKGYVKDFQLGMVAADIFPKGTTTHMETSIFSKNFLLPELPADRVAINATHIYYGNDQQQFGTGRATTAGTEDDIEFLPGTWITQKILLDATYIYVVEASAVYRGALSGAEYGKWFDPIKAMESAAINAAYIYYVGAGNSIGRAKIDGTEPNESWKAIGENPVDIEVDATYMYWATETGGAIARAKLDGSDVKAAFIDPAEQVKRIFVGNEHIYWITTAGKYIGRAKIDGTGVEDEWLLLDEKIRDVFVYNEETLYFASAEIAGQIGKIDLTALSGTGIENNGDAPAYPIVKINGPGSTFKLENATTEEFILLEGVELADGEYFEIDFKNHTIKKNGTTYAYNALVFASSNWWALEPGKNKIVTTGGTAEFSWQDTYI
jgi:hypothetical protein